MRKVIWLIPLVGVTCVLAFRPASSPTVRFLDVGQGDAAIISSGPFQVLIDGGPDNAVLPGIGDSMPLFDRTIDAVILTHPHTDHYRGLAEVFRRYDVGVLIVGVPGDEPEYRALLDAARSQEIPIVPAGGQVIRLPNDLSLRIVHPSTPFPDQPVEHPNDRSVVAMLESGGGKILFVGDAEEGEERELLKANAPLNADVLKVGHHGSKTSSGPEFLRAVTPRVAVMSLGKDNTFGHPSSQTLTSLEQPGAQSYRTDRQGTVTLTIEPSGFRVRTER